ncbi:TPA: hypothetical protein N0F65_010364, partial [Lagenidium giganteum]
SPDASKRTSHFALKMYKLTVSLVKAVDLVAADSIVMGGQSDPYVIFKVGSVTKKSSIIKQDLNPEWDPAELFQFDVENPEDSVLEVTVMDYDRIGADDLIGTTNIALAPFVDQDSSDVLMYEVDIPERFASQKRKSSLLLEIAHPPAHHALNRQPQHRDMHTLDITLVKATGLAASDFGAFGFGGKSDPYVIFKVGSKTHKSSMIKSNLNPVWSPPEKFRFKVDNPRDACLEIKVFDFDMIGADDLIGSKNLALAPFVEGRKAELMSYELEVPDCYSKQKCTSSLFLEISLVSDDSIDLVLELYENQYYHIVKQWCYDMQGDANHRRRWSQVNDSNVTSDSFEEVAPKVPATHSAEGWTLDVSQGDENGWMYAINFQGPWQKDMTTLAKVRRRKWINKCKPSRPGARIPNGTYTA